MTYFPNSGNNPGDEGALITPPAANLWTPYNYTTGMTLVNSGTVSRPTVLLSDFGNDFIGPQSYRIQGASA
jgi:hypothetical protein